MDSVTYGEGEGDKFSLLNDLIGLIKPQPDDWVIVVDDDVVFAAGHLGHLLHFASRAGFVLAQPAHSLASIHSHDFFNVAHPVTIASWTTFVEIGPLFALSPSGRQLFLPFPTDAGMGFGLEIHWWSKQSELNRIGIVDAVRIAHVAPVGRHYDQSDVHDRINAALAEHGLRSMSEVLQCRARWRRWQRRPPWLG